MSAIGISSCIADAVLVSATDEKWIWWPDSASSVVCVLVLERVPACASSTRAWGQSRWTRLAMVYRSHPLAASSATIRRWHWPSPSSFEPRQNAINIVHGWPAVSMNAIHRRTHLSWLRQFPRPPVLTSNDFGHEKSESTPQGVVL